jgi:phosphomannomutase
MKCSELRRRYPDYIITKKKLELLQGTDFKIVLDAVKKEFSDFEIDERDGIRIDYQGGWVQIRKSNTEPIIRIYAEGRTLRDAENLAEKVISIVKKR